MELRYNGVPSTSRKQARAGVKTRMGQVKFQFDFLNAPNFIAAPTPKTTANRLLILPATQANVTRHVRKCVAVIEKVYYLKNCVFTYVYKYAVDTVETLDSTLLLTLQVPIVANINFFLTISIHCQEI